MEHEEWKCIYSMYYKPLLLYALSLTKNQQDVEDLIQETFIKAFLSYEKSGSLKFWLVTVLKHEFFNLCRRKQREVLSEDHEKIENQQREKQEDFLEQIIRDEERRILFQEIQNLPVREKEILMEGIYFHFTDEEIAAMHHLSTVNVRKIRSRAKKKLIERLEGTL